MDGPLLWRHGFVARQKIHTPHRIIGKILFHTGETCDGFGLYQVIAVIEFGVPE
jgi:hypothetical protein